MKDVPTNHQTTTWERFTDAERRFFELLAQIDELPPHPDEPEVNFIPCAKLKSDLWKAVQGIRREDAARGGWPASIHAPDQIWFSPSSEGLGDEF